LADIIVAGNTSGSITIAAPAVAGSGVLTLPTGTDTLIGKATTDTLTNKSIAASQLTGTIAAAALPAGTVLQVVSTTKTDTFTGTSSTYIDLTGMSVTITPRSASNKILVSYSVNRSASVAAQSSIQILRDSTAICIGDAAGSRTRATTAPYPSSADAISSSITSAMTFLDSPATTSATTYKLQTRSDAATTIYINRSGGDANNADASRSASTITAMEIQG
jgi:hypothetical protein